MRINLKLSKKRLLIFSSGVLTGAIVILGIRFFAYQPEHVHYHANFVVYINGQREAFKGSQYYQEVAICSASKGITIPQQRAHLHDNNNSLVHVHDHSVTWGQFFDNLGWTIGPNFIRTDNGTFYMESGQAKLHILIDGQDYTGLTPITNMVIGDRSRLLVSFGDENNASLQQENKAVPATADKADKTNDPASCSGHEALTFQDRLRHLLK